jgi:hypothetical protein
MDVARACCDPEGLVPAGGMGPQIGIIRVENADAGSFQKAALDRPIAIKGAVALQMVRRQGGPDPDARGHLRGRLNLIAAQLHHQPIRSAPAPEAVQSQFRGGEAHVAAQRRIEASLAEQVMHQMGDGGFAIGARDPDPGDPFHGLPSGGDLPLHPHPLLAEGLQGGVVPADARADDHGVGLGQGGKRFGLQRCIQAHDNVFPAQAGGLALQPFT